MQQVVVSQTTAHQHIGRSVAVVATTGLAGHGGRFGSSAKNAGNNSDPTDSNSIEREWPVSLDHEGDDCHRKRKVNKSISINLFYPLIID